MAVQSQFQGHHRDNTGDNAAHEHCRRGKERLRDGHSPGQYPVFPAPEGSIIKVIKNSH